MEKYKIGNALGDGSFGSVTKAINEQTGQVVAIKKMKKAYNDWNECLSLNEVKVLSKLHHPNIIGLHQLIKHNNQLYFVFQYMSHNVFQLMQERKSIPHIQIRNIIYQTLQALAYMHRHGYFHRDLKPQNLLEMNGTVKIADFGLVREIRAKPPFTQYVSTRWYRAPEVLLRGRSYSSPMDIFAIGAIMAELYRCYPLFPGSNERDQINKILQIMGTPSKEEWPDGYKLASGISLDLPQHPASDLSSLIPTAPIEAIRLIQAMLQVNPNRRPTAQQALQHQYFQVKSPIDKPIFNEMEEIQEGDQGDWVKKARYKPGKTCKL